MPGWSDLLAEDPELAAEVRAAFTVGKHCTIATLRVDGSPRICGTEVAFEDGQLYIGAPADARKTADIRRDPRVALHSPTRDPEPDGSWPGEAKVAGVAVEVPVPHDYPSGAVRLRIDLTSAVFTGLTEDTPPRLRIRFWRPGRPVTTRFRS